MDHGLPAIQESALLLVGSHVNRVRRDGLQLPVFVFKLTLSQFRLFQLPVDFFKLPLSLNGAFRNWRSRHNRCRRRWGSWWGSWWRFRWGCRLNYWCNGVRHRPFIVARINAEKGSNAVEKAGKWRGLSRIPITLGTGKGRIRGRKSPPESEGHVWGHL